VSIFCLNLFVEFLRKLVNAVTYLLAKAELNMMKLFVFCIAEIRINIFLCGYVISIFMAKMD
jgi:hypothetical protein